VEKHLDKRRPCCARVRKIKKKCTLNPLPSHASSLRKRGIVKPPLPLADMPGEGSKSAGWEDTADDDDADVAADADADADAAADGVDDDNEVSASFASMNLAMKGAREGGGGLCDRRYRA
jgi:hypothetical protein